MVIDLERPRWRAREAADIAGVDVNQVGMLRQRVGFAIGTWKGSEYRYSVLDVAEFTCMVALWRGLGLSPGEAVQEARDLRRDLKDLLVNRLVHGFWSLGAYAVSESDLHRRLLYFDAIGERVITKLQLPLPVRPFPRSPEIAIRMVDAIMSYFESPPGIERWKRWHAALIKRGGKTTFDEAAAELGAPAWFLEALVGATRNLPKPDDPPIVKAVRPRAKPEYFAGVTLH